MYHKKRRGSFKHSYNKHSRHKRSHSLRSYGSSRGGIRL